MESRGSGILLHITSLFSPYGIGDLGPGAYRFADFLSQSRQRYWQVLPLNPTDSAFGNSPYSSMSAFAGDPLLISPDLMLQEGFLTPDEVRPPDGLPEHKVAYSRVRQYKEEILDLAYQRFQSRKESPDYEGFCTENADWLEDFVLFKALKAHFEGRAWNEWPQGYRDRQPSPLQEAGKALTEGMERERFLQYLFFKQWLSLKRYCNERGIRIIGDLPIYVNLDSVDVWRSPEIFKLDERRRPSFVAGVPPDYFSSTGQLWGNPVYNWDALKESGYAWWIRRFEHMFRLFDVVRIDHFRGLVAYWEVPAHEKTAVNGRWVSVSAEDFFHTLKGYFD
ncbi:MAG: 4-alpha-glucanotransferase, partial [candidate division NC10 bacterium]|nr:4-alpha-glucanotransferase [candidate division NC10 bacterium]